MKINKSFLIPLGVLPKGHFKYDDPVSAAIGGATAIPTAIINGIFNRNAQRSANAANKEIAQMNNEWSYKMMQEQNQFNYDMAKEFFNMENEYNDPSAVRERLTKAGYNPFMTNENGEMVNVAQATTPTASGLPTLATPTISPVPSPLNGVLPEVADSMLKFAQAKKLGLDTKWYEKLYKEQVKELEINNEWNQFFNNLRKEFEPSNQQWQSEQYRSNVEKTYKEIANLVQSIQNAQKQGEIYDEELAIKQFEKIVADNNARWIDKMNEQNFKNAVKQGNMFDASANASNAAASLSDRQRNLLGRTFNGVELSNDELKEVKNMIISSAQSESAANEANKLIEELNSEQNKNKWFQKMHQLKRFVGAIPVLGNVLDMFGGEAGKQSAKKFIK